MDPTKLAETTIFEFEEPDRHARARLLECLRRGLVSKRDLVSESPDRDEEWTPTVWSTADRLVEHFWASLTRDHKELLTQTPKWNVQVKYRVAQQIDLTAIHIWTTMRHRSGTTISYTSVVARDSDGAYLLFDAHSE